MLITLVVIIVAILFIILITKLDWRNLVFSVLIFLILEGVFRKWIFPQATNYIYFVKDFVILSAYLKYFIEGGKIRHHYINYMIALLAIWSLVQAFNPALGSPIIGFLGLRGYLLYIPLMWMLPDLFPNRIEDFYKFIRNYSLLVIPVCLLAIAQFFSPASSPLNVYASGSDQVATFGVATEAIARVTGTFPYITGFGTYLSVSFTLLIPLLTLQQNILWRSVTILELLLVITGSFMSGSRAVVFYEVLFLIGYLLLSFTRQPTQLIRVIKKFIAPIAIGTVILPFYFSKAINLFSQRTTQNSEEANSRFSSPITEPIMAIEQVIRLKSIDSYGTGAASQVTPLLRSLLNLSQQSYEDSLYTNIGEGESGRVALEIGAIGLVFWLAIRICLTISLWKVTRKVQHPFLHQLALSAFLFHVIQIATPVVFNPSMGIYYWFLSGFIFLLPELDRREQEHYFYYQDDQSVKSEQHV